MEHNTATLQELLIQQKRAMARLMQLNRIETEQELYTYIVEEATAITGADYVVMTGHQDPDGTLSVKAYNGFSSLVERIVEILGKDPRKLAYRFEDIDKEYYASFVSGKIAQIKDVHTLSGGQISKTASAMVQKFLGIDKIYNQTIFWKERAVGGITLFFKKDNTLINIEAAETFFNQSALVLRRLIEERRAKEAKDEAERANQAKNIFLANMSHEVRTPLNGIVGAVQLLEDTKLDEEQTELVRLLTRSARSMIALVNDILDLSRIQAGVVKINLHPVSLRDILSHVESLMRPRAEEKNLAFSIHHSRSIPQLVEGDALRIEQVLTNLIGNAVKFTEKGSVTMNMQVKVTKTQDEIAHVTFEITDTGIGFDEKVKKHLFEPFYQADMSSRKTHQGAGLGLAIVARLANMMGGTISVESEQKKGSTFTFSIPLRVVTP